MAKLQGTFDSAEYDDMSTFDALPAGEYPMQMTASKNCITNDKTGAYLKVEFTIIQGEFKGRKIWTNLNLKNKSKQCEVNARRELATICRACGKPVVVDSDELLGIPLLVKIKVVPAKKDYPAGNVPSGYKPMPGDFKIPASMPDGGSEKTSSDTGWEADDASGNKSALGKIAEPSTEEGEDDGASDKDAGWGESD